MTRRRLVKVGVVVCLGLAVGLAAWYASRPRPVSRANLARVRVGMTRAEVETILGRPPDHSGPVPPGSRPQSRDTYGVWRGGNDTIIVIFRDEDGRVSATEFVEGPPADRLDGLCTWMGW